MSLQGPILIVANKPAGGLAQAFTDAGAFPVIETSWAGAATAATEVKPSAIVLSEPDAADSDAAAAVARHVATAAPFIPMIIRVRDDAAPAVPEALSIPDDAPVEQLIARVSSALRLRTLHSTVIGRAKSLQGRAQHRGRTAGRRSARRCHGAADWPRPPPRDLERRGRRADGRDRRAQHRSGRRLSQGPRGRRHRHRRRPRRRFGRRLPRGAGRGRAFPRPAGGGAGRRFRGRQAAEFRPRPRSRGPDGPRGPIHPDAGARDRAQAPAPVDRVQGHDRRPDRAVQRDRLRRSARAAPSRTAASAAPGCRWPASSSRNRSTAAPAWMPPA